VTEPSDVGHSVHAMSSKRTSARAAKTKPWGEHFLTTNPKSPLVHVDLVVRLRKGVITWPILFFDLVLCLIAMDMGLMSRTSLIFRAA
jgi:hypothetical protein